MGLQPLYPASQVTSVKSHTDPSRYLVCLTIGPAFFCAAIYVSFRRVVHSYGSTRSPLQPRTISVIFMTTDFTCLVLQATGGAIASTSGGETQDEIDMGRAGIDIMIAGLALQVVSLTFFIVYAGLFFSLWRKPNEKVNPVDALTRGLKWNGLVYGMSFQFSLAEANVMQDLLLLQS